jgi:hypothetical protein
LIEIKTPTFSVGMLQHLQEMRDECCGDHDAAGGERYLGDHDRGGGAANAATLD